MNERASPWLCTRCQRWTPPGDECGGCGAAPSEDASAPRDSLGRAREALEQGRASLALRLLRSPGVLEEHEADTLPLLARAYEAQQRHAEAADALQRHLDRAGDSAPSLRLAQLLRQAGAPDEALAIAERSEEPAARLLRAELWLEHDPEPASCAARIEQQAERASFVPELCEVAGRAWRRAALAAADAGDTEQAERAWQRAGACYRRYLEQVEPTLEVALRYADLLDGAAASAHEEPSVRSLLQRVEAPGQLTARWHRAWMRVLLAGDDPDAAKQAGEQALGRFADDRQLVELSQRASRLAWEAKRSALLGRQGEGRAERAPRGDPPTPIEGATEPAWGPPPTAAPSFLLSVTELLDRNALGPVKEMPALQREIVEVLCRYHRGNALVTGPAGCGKSALLTAVAVQFARREGLPRLFQGYWPYLLDQMAIVGGTDTVGEQEERVAKLTKFCTAHKIVLFIDDFHLLRGLGSYRGRSAGMETLLQPLMTTGKTKLVGAASDATVDDIMRVAGLERRLTRVKMPAMDVKQTTELLEWLRPTLEEHFERVLEPRILELAARLAEHHIQSRALPDSAISLLNQGCAKALMEEDDVVSADHLIRSLAQLLKVPIEQVHLDHMSRLLEIESLLSQRVIGQDRAIRTVADIIRMTKAQLDLHSHRPDGVFLFVGSTGVGKTELAMALAEVLSNEESGFIRMDMSEFSEKHAVSRLFGTTPGYVGYEQQGQLTGALRLNPSAVVLLDEIEKAHPQVYDVFLQVFDAGRITDGKGQVVDCSRATFVMTSNLGTAALTSTRLGFARDRGPDDTSKVVLAAIRKHFRPEFLNRLDAVVAFEPLDDDVLRRIIQQKLHRLAKRFLAKGFELRLADDLVPLIVERIDPKRTGARGVNRAIEQLIAIPASRAVLADRTPRTLRAEIVAGQVRIS